MTELTEIKGVGPVLAKACADNGYNNVEKIAAAMLDDLVAVPGISVAKAGLVIAAAQDLLQNVATPANEAAPAEAADEEEKPKKDKSKKKKKKDKKKDKKKSKKKKKKNKKKDKKS